MSAIPIIIGDQTILFPNSAASPDWSQAIIAFAQAVAKTTSATAGPYDIPATTFTINNSASATNITGLSFQTPTAGSPAAIGVSSAQIRYGVYQTTSTQTLTETGIINVSYNPENPSGIWDISQISNDTSNSLLVFSILDSGQMQYTNGTVTGSNYQGFITFAAQSLSPADPNTIF